MQLAACGRYFERLETASGSQTGGAGIGFDAVLDIIARHQFRVADADRFGVDHWHAELGFQLFRGDHVGIDLAAQGNNRLGALGDQLFADRQSALDDDIMVARQVAGVVQADGADAADELASCHRSAPSAWCAAYGFPTAR